MKKLNKYPIVIIGGSIAAISFIRTLRQQENDKKILLIYGEDRLPYKRTKINKNMVRGFEKDDFLIADNQWYADNKVDLINGWVDAIDLTNHVVSTKKGAQFAYEKLLLATGAASVLPRISGIEMQDIHKVQNAFDVEKLLLETKTKQSYLIIGGGVEGIETADQLHRKGKDVTIVGRMKYPMQKLFPTEFMEDLVNGMLKIGVEVYNGVSISSIKKVNGIFETRLKNETRHFDVIVGCTGAVPNIVLAKNAGLNTANGIVVDEWMQTSDDDVLAAGDVAQHKNGEVTGLWHAAEHQGKLAALNLYEKVERHTLPPYRLKTEVFGQFLFSAAYEGIFPEKFEIIKEADKDILRWLYFKDGVLKSVVMRGDKDRAKVYQQALMEAWDKETTLKKIPLPVPIVFSFGAGF
ncbi:NAD(P)/FAD-dependent oxidoreductase [Carboxylicivirga sp. N1Y90]|uniref:NAD(P)/FAD-dependent oxidoreductase n=1 Tax=Carboxylicivirga fragile TaxID=3417571 RepID=UPI003D339E67|nr:FAD-dependent oxidoreductase [Marinilabiliaceae bacterium N1Y90]